MQILKEFKEFVSKGNVMDLAVGVIIGGAFGQIVNSLVNDIVMPPIGLILGGVDFSEIKIVLRDAYTTSQGVVIPALSLNIGNFFQLVFNFIIISAVIFVVIKVINKLKREEQKKEDQKEIVKKTAQVLLLEEIRDILKNQK
ncbi:MAG: large-conductance mechanosensitive channel protein MscL [Candidatus Dojkabacteria bacterium]